MTFRLREFPAPDQAPSSQGWDVVLEAVDGEQRALKRRLLRLTFLDPPLLERMLEELPSLVLRGLDEARARESCQQLEEAGGRVGLYPTGSWRKALITFSDDLEEHRKALILVGSYLNDARATSIEQTALEAALREAIANASLHGNHQDPQKKIRVSFLNAGRDVHIAVEDQGSGFDYEQVLADESCDIAQLAEERLKEGRIGGLGLAVIQRCTDSVTFDPPGNCIRFSKRLSGA